MLGLAWNLASLARAEERNADWWVRLAITGLVVGALYPLNAWDYPTFLLITVAASWFGMRAFSLPFWEGALTVGVASIGAWLPFWLRYDPPVREVTTGLLGQIPIVRGLATSIGIHVGERTGAGEFLTIFGVAYVASIILLVTDRGFRDGADFPVLVSAAVLTIIPGVLLAAPVLPLCGIPLAVAAHRPRGPDRSPGIVWRESDRV